MQSAPEARRSCEVSLLLVVCWALVKVCRTRIGKEGSACHSGAGKKAVSLHQFMSGDGNREVMTQFVKEHLVCTASTRVRNP